MWRFMLMYFLLYGGLNFYGLWRLHAGLGGGRGLLAGILVLGVLGVAAPVVTHTLPSSSPVRAGMLLSYLWMAGIFWFASLSLVADLWNLAAGTGRLQAFTLPRLPAMPATVAKLVLVAAAMVWGYFEAAAIRLKNVEIPVAGLTAPGGRLRLAVIADLHLSPLNPGYLLPKIKELLAVARPDVLLSTGDLIDSDEPDTAADVLALAGIQAPLGKFAVTGNHEFYRGAAATARMLREAGFTLLRGEVAELPGTGVALAGVDDPARGQVEGVPPDPEAQVLAKLPAGAFAVLLKHRPQVTVAARERVDLQLSGHTHQGQLFPFGVFCYAAYGQVHGRLRPAGSRLRLYVSPGTGAWGPPLRLFARPEITVIDLVRP